MQAKFYKVGNQVDYTPSSAVVDSQVVVQNDLVGVAERAIAANVLGALTVLGVFDVVKATGAINAGAAVYWDADGTPVTGVALSGAATTSTSGNTFMGKAVIAAGSSDETVRVRFEGVAAVTNTVHNELTAAITDPGASGAIPITVSGTCQLVTATAETRTLAAPTDVGQVICLTMKTDGGNCVVTASAAINAAGNTIMTFAEVTDTILLIGAISGSSKVWRVLGNDGVALS